IDLRRQSGLSHQSLGSAVSIGTTFGWHNRYTQALTTALGAGLGGAIGGGSGAGIGAASGALGGVGLGALGSSNAPRSIQAQYDNAFAACMFSLGNTVPSIGPTMSRPQSAAPPAPR